MSFTISDARTLAESWTDEILEDDQILEWGNEFVRKKVNDKLWQTSTEAYANSIANTWYTLPADFSRSIGAEDSNGMEYSNYVIRNGKISFAIDGSYTLNYAAYPAKIAAITATASGEPPVTVPNNVPLPDAFIYPMAEFLLFKLFNIELDDEDSKAAAQEYEARYTNSLKELYDKMEIDSQNEAFQVKMRW